MPDRVAVVSVSPRVAAGLLSRAAWSALESADLVVCTGERVGALTDAGVPVQVFDGDPAELARDLVSRTGSEVVACLLPAEGASALAVALAALADERGAPGPEVELVDGSWDLPGAHLLDLVAVMDRLRSPGGCPWDAEQTHRSLVEYLVEEAYETVEAIETEDDGALREELGDVLLQVAFHARIAQEHDDPWDIDDVADAITEKLVRRHPHVFADHDARTAEDVEANWRRLKAAEKGRESATDGVPDALPALLRAGKLLRRSAHVEGVTGVAPELEAAAGRAFDAADGDLGDLLLALVARANASGVDAEQELREALRRHEARVRAAEREARDSLGG